MALDRMVVFCFKHYADIKQAVYEKRMDPGTQKVGGGGHSFISDPTAQRAIRNTTELDAVTINYGVRDSMLVRRPESWLTVVERTKAYYKGQLQIRLIELAFEKGVSWRVICKEMTMRRATYYTLMNDIVSFSTGVALGLGLSD